MTYVQFLELKEIAVRKNLTLAEYDQLYKNSNGDYITMKEKLLAIK